MHQNQNPNEAALVRTADTAAMIAPTIQQRSVNELLNIAKLFLASGMYQFNKPEQAVALMLTCQSEGIDPIQAMKRYHIIQGRPAMRADAMLAEYQSRGGRVEWKQRTDTVCEAVFTHPSSGAVPVRWTIEDAKRANLLSKGGNWNSYPRQMLTARVVSEGIRTSLPAVVVGIYTPEETVAFDPLPIQATATEVYDAPQPSAPAIPPARKVPAPAPAPTFEDNPFDDTAVAPPSKAAPSVSAKTAFDEAKAGFDRVAESCGLQLGVNAPKGLERGQWANVCLGRPQDSRAPITLEDWAAATEALPGRIEEERASMAARTQAQAPAPKAVTEAAPVPAPSPQTYRNAAPEPTVNTAPSQPMLADDDDELFADPFASESPNSAIAGGL